MTGPVRMLHRANASFPSNNIVSVSSLPSLYQHLCLFRFSGSLASGDVRLTSGLVVARNVHALYITVVVQVI